MPRAIRITSASGALTVNLTGPAGNAPVVYADSAFSATVTLPATVADSTQTTFWLGSPGAYTLSVKTSAGTEIASDNNTTRTVDLETPGTIAALTYDARLNAPVAGDSGHSQAGGSAASAASLTPTAVKTAAYTASPSDFVPVDTTSGNVTITLPTAPADKTQIGVKHVVRGGTNTVTIAAGGTDKFNAAGGSTTATLSLLREAAIFQYASASGLWYALNNDLPLSQLGTLATKSAAAVPGDLTASGTPSSTTFLRGDGTWATPSGSSSPGVGVLADDGSSGYNYGAPGIAFNSASNDTPTIGVLHFRPFILSVSATLTQIQMAVSTASTTPGAVMRFGIYTANGKLMPTALVADLGTLPVDSTGAKTLTVSQALSAGNYCFAYMHNGTNVPSLNAAWVRGGVIGYRGTSDFNSMPTALSATQTFGAMPSTPPTPAFSGSFNIGVPYHALMRFGA